MIEKAKMIYPMSMLNEVVGSDEKVSTESENFEFDRNEPYFHYEEGKILESLDDTLAEFAEEQMGMIPYTKVQKVA